MTTFGAVARQGAGWLSLLGVAALAGTLSTLALPAVLGHTIDAVVARADSTRWFALAAALIAVGVAADLVEAYAGTVCAAGAAAWLRNRLVRHLLAAGPERTTGFETGDLVSRVSGNAVDAAH